ncbi:MAG: FAD-dependent oxidoreductase [Parvibaculaceae bacterium]
MHQRNNKQVVIVGGGQAAAQAIQSLRELGFPERITLVSDEALAPYYRPLLSKQALQAGFEPSDLPLHPATWYKERDIELVLSQRVDAINKYEKTIELHSGEALSYEYLILATGGKPRLFSNPRSDLSRVHYLRTVDDAARLRALLQPNRKIVIIGGGYIGLEVASAAITSGATVTIVEQQQTLLSRVASSHVSRFVRFIHEQNGVIVKTGSTVEAIENTSQSVSRLRFGDGGEVLADDVVVGIGMVANDELAIDAGLGCGNGVLVDEAGRTTDPNIFAIGDCSRRSTHPFGANLRLESVQNAIEQARRVAAAITNTPRPNAECPWFWSDQYDFKLQIAGVWTGEPETVLRGSIESGSFSVFLLNDGYLSAAESINRPGDFAAAKRLIMSGKRIDTSMLTDETIPIRAIVKSTSSD